MHIEFVKCGSRHFHFFPWVVWSFSEIILESLDLQTKWDTTTFQAFVKCMEIWKVIWQIAEHEMH